jgi:cytochrome c
MVCHGDEGQGLEAWRQSLDPDDRDCWQSRCHAVNHTPCGFQLAGSTPPVMGPGTLARFQTAADLYDNPRANMPWQAPGTLTDDEYWQITANLTDAHGVEPGEEPLTRQRAEDLPLHADPSGASP